MNETKFKKVLGSLEASVDIPKIALAAFSAFSSHTMGLPLSGALLEGVATLGFSLTYGSFAKNERSTPFEYVTSIHKRLY